MDALEVKIAAQNNRATVALGKLAEYRRLAAIVPEPAPLKQ